MTMPVVHSTFSIERTFPAPPSKVFRAFADEDTKVTWFHGPPEWEPDVRTMDFREGGSETSTGGPPGGWVSRFVGTYHEIVEDERIVYSYEMYLDDRRISVSLATLELESLDGGSSTRLLVTEQGAYFEGSEGEAGPASREEGTNFLMDELAKVHSA